MPPATAPPPDARAHLAALRAIRAAGPGPEATALRTAYLDLLKLALCDLVGVATTSVGAVGPGAVVSRELRGEARKMRTAGLDWPLHGLTMVGLGRLDDLQACVEAVVRDGVPGDVIEVGSWRGGASMLMRATLDTLGDERTVCVADSFAGFPAGDAELGAFDHLAAPLDEVRDAFARLGLGRGVEFVPGFFETTLGALTDRSWALVRLDADTYGPSRHALDCLYPRLAVGGWFVVDDYGSFEGCRRAVDAFRAEHGIAEPIEHVDSTCSRWRRTSDAPVRTAPAPVAPDRAPRARPRPVAPHVPTAQEHDLREQLAAARARVGELEAAIAGGVRARLARRLGR